MTYIIGADPGLTGCLVVLTEANFTYVEHLQMPTMKVGTSNRVNGAALARWLRDWDNVSMLYLEAVHSRPGEGAHGAFNFGHNAGVLEGIVQGIGIPYTRVKPDQWKKRAGLIGTDKDASRTRAIQLYPGIADLDLKAKGQALGDAILIARYGEA